MITRLFICVLTVFAFLFAEETAFPVLEKGKVKLIASESPYLLEQGVVFSTKDTLEIEPGVTVLMGEYAKVMFRGYVKIIGTAESPIIFKSVDSTKSWNGLHLISANRPFEIKNLIIENAFRNTVFRSKGIFEDVKFINNYYGLWVDDVPEVFLARCEFSRNRYAVSVRAGQVMATATKIKDNVYGLYLEAGGIFNGDKGLIQKNLEADIRNESDELNAQGKRVNRNIWHSLETSF